MRQGPLRVLQVGTVESGGGAASAAANLARGIKRRGGQSWMAVGRRTSDDPDVFVLPDDDRTAYRLSGYAALQRALGRCARHAPGRGWGWLARSLRLATHPRAVLNQLAGTEDFEFPGTYRLLDLAPGPPDVVHCHNLHGGYFDLRALEWLSRRVPTVLTLHDGWLLSGHCAHSPGCDRWMTGCGACPDLTTYPAVSRDRTSANWTRKRNIYARSRLYVTAPSAWLMRRIEQSMLAPFVQRSRVIPNGVDVSVFRPAAKEDARRALGFETDVSMTLLVLGRRDVPWIDREMVGGVVGSIAARHSNRAIVVVVGDAPVSAIPADACVRRVPYQFDPNVLAQYYRAADVYVHCARAATFPATILEAMACGTPVVAVAAGGIVEQVRSPSLGDADADASTGLLVAEGDRDAMARAVSRVLDDCGLRARLGRNAIHDVRKRFELGRQVDAYIDWYRTIIEHWNQHARAECDPTPALAGEPVRVAVD